jgi:hypothetical protein
MNDDRSSRLLQAPANQVSSLNGDWMSRSHWTAVTIVLCLSACGHSDPPFITTSAIGPAGSGADVTLTFNSDQDYWPIWTEDGAGILYAFGNPGAPSRCVGLLPPAGGTRSWQLCDNRASMADSVTSFPAYALGADGRLLYLEATGLAGIQSTAPAEVTLWLADSAAPFQRQALLALPAPAGDIRPTWLADISWTGPTTFLALAQDLQVTAHCRGCGPEDSLFLGLAVVRGTISGSTATLTSVSGTTGATSYTVAEAGSTIVFTVRDDIHLYKVPAAGGAPVAVASVLPSGGGQVMGVSCKGSACVVATAAVTLTTPGNSPFVSDDPAHLLGVSLATGAVQTLVTGPDMLATPQISPLTGDVVAQVGGLFGHLQTATTSPSDLHLFLGLVP